MFQQVRAPLARPFPPPHTRASKHPQGAAGEPRGLPGLICPGRPFPFSRQHLNRPASREAFSQRRPHRSGSPSWGPHVRPLVTPREPELCPPLSDWPGGPADHQCPWGPS